MAVEREEEEQAPAAGEAELGIEPERILGEHVLTKRGEERKH